MEMYFCDFGQSFEQLCTTDKDGCAETIWLNSRIEAESLFGSLVDTEGAYVNHCPFVKKFRIVRPIFITYRNPSVSFISVLNSI